jgi:hypothetical protein
MKHVVIESHLSSERIRPDEGLKEMFRLLSEDIQRFWATSPKLRDVACPACLSSERDPFFVRDRFEYFRCRACHSVFLGKRPSADALAGFWAASSAKRFWSERVLPTSANARKAELWDVYADWIEEFILVEFRGKRCELRAHGVPAEFGRMLEARSPLKPILSLSDSGSPNVVIAVDLLDRMADPETELARLCDGLGAGGLLFLTFCNGTGIEVMTLRERSKTAYPPAHLNLMSLKGVERLLDRMGFELLELSTPGRLDLERIRQAAEQDPSVELPYLLRVVLFERDESALEELQAFLQASQLSSYTRLVARKRQNP